MKLGEAYVDLRAKDGPLLRSLANAEKATVKTAKAMDKTAKATTGLFNLTLLEKAFKGFEKIVKVIRDAAKQTDEGKWAVEDYEKAIGGLVNSLLGLIDLDAVSFFRMLEGAIKSLTASTREQQHLLLSWAKTWNDIKLFVSEAFDNGAGGAARQNKLRQNSEAMKDELIRLQGEMTVDLQKNVQKRVDALEKEKEKSARISSDLSDVWKMAQEKFSGRSTTQQNRAIERERMMNNPKPFAPDKQALGDYGRWLMEKGARQAAQSGDLRRTMIEGLATQDPSSMSGSDREAFDNMIRRLAEQRRGGEEMTPRELIQSLTGTGQLPPPNGQQPPIPRLSFADWKSQKLFDEMVKALNKIVVNTDEARGGRFTR